MKLFKKINLNSVTTLLLQLLLLRSRSFSASSINSNLIDCKTTKIKLDFF